MNSPCSGENFSGPLLSWYALNRRNLPWRKNPTPYRIFIAEVMLQQTQASRVVPYFARWMKRFRNFSMVASASLDELLLLWEGLGYYTRLHSLAHACVEIVENHGGVFPRGYREALALPGVGPYTAGAVLSMAYNLPHPAVDANAKRVLARYCDLEVPVDKGNDALYRERSLFFMPAGKAGSFNQALMELGALCCLPGSPRCRDCPVQKGCLALSRGTLAHRPVRLSRAKVRHIQVIVGIILWNGHVFLRRRSQGGLWPGMWEFPNWEWNGENEAGSIRRLFMREYGLEPEFQFSLSAFSCSFAGIRAKMFPLVCTLSSLSACSGENVRWTGRSELFDLPLPSAHRRIAGIIPFSK